MDEECLAGSRYVSNESCMPHESVLLINSYGSLKVINNFLAPHATVAEVCRMMIEGC